ncbi:hypothetical protein DFH08DRAFT_955177 [Mycena albidolilacea]|uniref:Uncharacterized protein n=1 Tax=Mycena albidolilacea TaxID=1033008 RepID=A0AAD7ADI2_9AGAR|nr:hypothetical protein DFH08DRAFT_955177 [Mycena albidolilacea]
MGAAGDRHRDLPSRAVGDAHAHNSEGAAGDHRHLPSRAGATGDSHHHHLPSRAVGDAHNSEGVAGDQDHVAGDQDRDTASTGCHGRLPPSPPSFASRRCGATTARVLQATRITTPAYHDTRGRGAAGDHHRDLPSQPEGAAGDQHYDTRLLSPPSLPSRRRGTTTARAPQATRITTPAQGAPQATKPGEAARTGATGDQHHNHDHAAGRPHATAGTCRSHSHFTSHRRATRCFDAALPDTGAAIPGHPHRRRSRAALSDDKILPDFLVKFYSCASPTQPAKNVFSRLARRTASRVGLARAPPRTLATAHGALVLTRTRSHSRPAHAPASLLMRGVLRYAHRIALASRDAAGDHHRREPRATRTHNSEGAAGDQHHDTASTGRHGRPPSRFSLSLTSICDDVSASTSSPAALSPHIRPATLNPRSLIERRTATRQNMSAFVYSDAAPSPPVYSPRSTPRTNHQPSLELGLSSCHVPPLSPGPYIDRMAQLVSARPTALSRVRLRSPPISFAALRSISTQNLDPNLKAAPLPPDPPSENAVGHCTLPAQIDRQPRSTSRRPQMTFLIASVCCSPS